MINDLEKKQLSSRFIENVKLVIWDLDDTFWQGTLTEGGINYSHRHHNIVTALARHGIVSSISSNNNFEDAAEVLRKHDVIDYFIFPKINWGKKSGHISTILEEVQLRPENVIFLDDKPRVQNAVLAQVPNLLAVMTAEEFSQCFDKWVSEKQESDPQLTRLQRYQLLGKKVSAKSNFVVTEAESHAFLRSCDIKCEIGKVTEAELHRVAELVERSNQINFTQRRDSLQAIRKLSMDDTFECRYVQVWDKFGDYGITGFYALNRADHTLHHFVFSCRILQMGVEAAVHEYLGFPKVLFAPGKARMFDAISSEYKQPDWITFGQFSQHRTQEAAQSVHEKSVTFIGPCELEVIGYGLGSILGNKLKFDYHVHHRNNKGHYIGVQGHSSLLNLARKPDVISKYEQTLSQIPWLDPVLYDTSVFEKENSVVVLSSVRNVQSANYIHKSGEFSIPSLDNLCIGTIDFSSPVHQLKLEELLKKSIGAPDFDVSLFQDEFEFGGLVSKESYAQSLKDVAALMPNSSKLVVLTVVEIPPNLSGFEAVSPEFVENWRLQHSAINAAIREASAAEPEKIIMLDINQYVTEDDLNREVPGLREARHAWENFRPMYTYYHFERKTYIDLGFKLLDLMVKWELFSMTQEERDHFIGLANSVVPEELGML
ncbi:hypothetical protein [Pseudoalteromonas luteoviolacea]|uniref:Uncharacterized protein n=1 Tax=Pseudoalteromonas luteoviolacea S4060-1 TaxID=1365257 RepID=A0A167MEH1_9GAMM|nr:hypothetical protein [Pseudoalteromonas luteoviolacea]KZN66259.1 hypothetical protein N478_20295 [Pseudoalteromonas luteoviolacea S4060-1]